MQPSRSARPDPDDADTANASGGRRLTLRCVEHLHLLGLVETGTNELPRIRNRALQISLHSRDLSEERRCLRRRTVMCVDERAPGILHPFERKERRLARAIGVRLLIALAMARHL